MDPPAFPTSNLSIPINHNSRTSNAHSPMDLESSTAGVDRRTKKRIQNRVAQRTYRTRIKQRLYDLQQQVHQLQRKEGEQQHNTMAHKNEAGDKGDESVVLYPSLNQMPDIASFRGQRGEPFALKAAGQNMLGISSTDSVSLASVTGQSTNAWNPPMGDTSFLYNPLPLRSRSTFDLSSETTMAPSSPSRPRLDVSSDVLGHSMCHAGPPKDTLAFCRGNEDGMQNYLHKRAERHYSQDGEPYNPHPFGSPYPPSWNHNLDAHLVTAELKPATEHVALATPPNFYQNKIVGAPFVSVGAQWPGNWVPNQAETMEKHFEEIRKRSTSWSALQRRGYENAMLKAAEEICAVEYNDLRTANINSDMNEDALEDMLPNLYALLTGVVSSNPKLSQTQVSQTVFWSMRTLCGLDGPQSRSTGLSRQSPR